MDVTILLFTSYSCGVLNKTCNDSTNPFVFNNVYYEDKAGWAANQNDWGRAVLLVAMFRLCVLEMSSSDEQVQEGHVVSRQLIVT